MATKGTNCTVRLDISGTLFKTPLSTLRSIPGSRLAQLDKTSSSYDETQDAFYFNQDADMFKQILNTHRYGTLHVPRDICPQQFKMELAFWKIPIKLLAPCCWKTMYETQDDVDVTVDLWNRDYMTQADSHLYNLNMLNKNEQDSSAHKSRNNQDQSAQETTDKQTWSAQKPSDKQAWSAHKESDKQDRSAHNKVSGELEISGDGLSSDMLVRTGMEDLSSDKLVKTRTKPNKVWLFLEEPASSSPAKIWCFIYVALVVLNVFNVLIWAEPDFRVDSYLIGSQKPWHNDSTSFEYFNNLPETIQLLIRTDQHPVLLAIDCFCLIVFILEVVVSFCSCPEKTIYHRDPKNVVRPVLCIAMTITILIDVFKSQVKSFSPTLIKFCASIRSISVLRLLLILKLRKLYKGLDIMLLSLQKSVNELRLLVFAFGILVVIYGAMMFSVEIETDKFSNVWVSLWWSIITMTTVGYGDFYPTSGFGYFIGAICAINGLIVLALPMACIASNFSTLYERQADIDKHKAQITLERKFNSTEQFASTVDVKGKCMHKSSSPIMEKTNV